MPREVKTPAPDEVIEILKDHNVEPTPDAIRGFYFHWTIDSIMAKFDRNAEYQEAYDKAYNEAYREAYQKAYEESFKEGLEEGYAETLEEVCKAMENAGVSPEKIQEFREYAANNIYKE